MKASDIISGWNIVREDNYSHAMIEMDGLFYIATVDGYSYQFKSVLPCDLPAERGCRWVANWTEGGLRYVASGRSRAAANAQWRKHIVPITKQLEYEETIYA